MPAKQAPPQNDVITQASCCESASPRLFPSAERHWPSHRSLFPACATTNPWRASTPVIGRRKSDRGHQNRPILIPSRQLKLHPNLHDRLWVAPLGYEHWLSTSEDALRFQKHLRSLVCLFLRCLSHRFVLSQISSRKRTADMIYEDLHKTLSAGSRTASAKMGSAMHPVESLLTRG